MPSKPDIVAISTVICDSGSFPFDANVCRAMLTTKTILFFNLLSFLPALFVAFFLTKKVAI